MRLASGLGCAILPDTDEFAFVVEFVLDGPELPDHLDPFGGIFVTASWPSIADPNILNSSGNQPHTRLNPKRPDEMWSIGRHLLCGDDGVDHRHMNAVAKTFELRGDRADTRGPGERLVIRPLKWVTPPEGAPPRERHLQLETGLCRLRAQRSTTLAQVS